jgi:hypothetical protein
VLGNRSAIPHSHSRGIDRVISVIVFGMSGERRRLLWLLVAALSLCPFVEAQGGHPPLIGKRDKGAEDVVAKEIETIRAEAKLPALIRIKHHSDLEQTLCTAAQGTPGSYRTPHSGFYRTMHPETTSPELRSSALVQDRARPRYSVAVWQVKDPQTGEIQYWVGVELYISSTEEFMDHFTDDVFYKNAWKKEVLPQCRDN